jgi:hypothetical protein
MIQKIKQFILVGLAGSMLMAPGLLVPVLNGVASADIQTNLCAGVDAAAGTNNCSNQTNGDASTGLTTIAQTITKYFSIIVGAISIIMIIYGGFRYITSGGDSGKVGSAKNTLIYAIVGLIIVALAQLIVRLVITQANTTTNTLG